jgi:hypothetical protein
MRSRNGCSCDRPAFAFLPKESDRFPGVHCQTPRSSTSLAEQPFNPLPSPRQHADEYDVFTRRRSRWGLLLAGERASARRRASASRSYRWHASIWWARASATSVPAPAGLPVAISASWAASAAPVSRRRNCFIRPASGTIAFRWRRGDAVSVQLRISQRDDPGRRIAGLLQPVVPLPPMAAPSSTCGSRTTVRPIGSGPSVAEARRAHAGDATDRICPSPDKSCDFGG